MKAKNPFEELLNKHLTEFAKGDSVFAEKLKATTKTLTGCATYIFKEAKKHIIKTPEGSVAPIDDATVYGWAVHFFEEDTIPEPTKQEKEQIARQVEVGTFGSMSLAALSTL